MHIYQITTNTFVSLKAYNIKKTLNRPGIVGDLTF